MTVRKFTYAIFFGLFSFLFHASVSAQNTKAPLIHKCTNGMSIEVTPNPGGMYGEVGISFATDASEDAPVDFRFHREGHGSKRRYVHGRSSVTFDGVILTLDSPLEFRGRPIGSVACELTGPAETEPTMQAGNAGRYFKLNRSDYPQEFVSSRYEPIESACFFKPAPLVWAFAPRDGAEAKMIAYSSDNSQDVELFTVDRLKPRDGKALFRLNLERSSNAESAIAEFISPLNRSADKPSATAGLARLFIPEGGGVWGECHDNDNIVFMGHAEGAHFLISLEGGNLVLEILGLDGEGDKTRFGHGQVSFDKGIFNLNFFDGNDRFRINIDPEGRPFFNHILIEDGEGVSFAKFPEFYFSANSSVLGSIDAKLDNETARFLENRSDCDGLSEDNFADEDEDRLKFLAQARLDLGCDQIEQRHAEVLEIAKSREDIRLIRFLQSGLKGDQTE